MPCSAGRETNGRIDDVEVLQGKNRQPINPQHFSSSYIFKVSEVYIWVVTII